jgi:hypothetical protein
MIIRLVKLALSWLVHNATFNLYTSRTQVGRLIGKHDEIDIPDLYIVLNIVAGGKVILSICWQAV